jgi:hypothetical protein
VTGYFNQDRDCKKGGRVQRDDTFLLHDEVGKREKIAGATNLFVTGIPGQEYLRLPENPGDPGQQPMPFKLVPICATGMCGFCLRSGDRNKPGLAEDGGWDDRYITRVVNGRYCIPIMLEQCPCLDDEWRKLGKLHGVAKKWYDVMDGLDDLGDRSWQKIMGGDEGDD